MRRISGKNMDTARRRARYALRRSTRLRAQTLGILTLIALGALLASCQIGSNPGNPPGYPANVSPNSSIAPAPTRGGVVPTPVGVNKNAPSYLGGTSEKSGVPSSGDTGLSQVDGGSGSASISGGKSQQKQNNVKPDVTVTINDDGSFQPASVTIKAGQTVEWKNAGRSAQTVTADPTMASNKSHVALPSSAQPWDSGPLNAGKTYQHTFKTPGDYTYFTVTFERAGRTGHVTVKS